MKLDFQNQNLHDSDFRPITVTANKGSISSDSELSLSLPPIAVPFSCSTSTNPRFSRVSPSIWNSKTMPSSPKFFHARQPPSALRPTVLLVGFCLVFGLSGFIFGLVSLLHPSHQYKCLTSKSRSVKVIWERGSSSSSSSSQNGLVLNVGDGNDNNKRKKVMGFVGIQTGFRSTGRRQSLRKTWMPSDAQGLQRYRFSLSLFLININIWFMIHFSFNCVYCLLQMLGPWQCI